MSLSAISCMNKFWQCSFDMEKLVKNPHKLVSLHSDFVCSTVHYNYCSNWSSITLVTGVKRATVADSLRIAFFPLPISHSCSTGSFVFFQAYSTSASYSEQACSFSENSTAACQPWSRSGKAPGLLTASTCLQLEQPEPFH